MRRVLVIGMALAAVLTLAAPAQAAKPTKTVYNSASANAFWYFTDSPAKNTTRDTVWYIGAYTDGTNSFSDLYRTVTTCRGTGARQRCTSAFAYGAIDNPNFTLASDLSSAHLEGTYVLDVYDDAKRATGTTETVSAITDFTGVGTVQSNGGSYTYRDDFISIRGTFNDAYRAAEAIATVNGNSLGETYDANLSSSTSTTVEHTR